MRVFTALALALWAISGTAQAATLPEPPTWADGLQAGLDPRGAGILLSWDAVPGNSYVILRDAIPIAVTSTPWFVDATWTADAVYGVQIQQDGLAPPPIHLPTASDGCAPTAVGTIHTPPFVRVIVYENCLPGGILVPETRIIGDSPLDIGTRVSTPLA
jgi:hypothetical protein